MEHFSEEHSRLLLSKEWLVKIDTAKSAPYLFKFHSSMVDLTCCVLLTDTKSVWAEVLNSKQFARRWRECNAGAPPLEQASDEEAWRSNILELLSKVHTVGGIADVNFEIVDSNFADVAFELECGVFRWRWGTYYTGPKTSADIVSKHLVLPLISVTHLAFSSTDAVSGMSDGDVEKAVDKVGRTARRTLGTHVKNALSKPRVATSVRRMTTIFNFLPELRKHIFSALWSPRASVISIFEAAVTSAAEKPDLLSALQEAETVAQSSSVKAQNNVSASVSDNDNMSSHEEEKAPKPSVDPDTATEPEDSDAKESDVLKKDHGRGTSSKPSLFVKPTSSQPTPDPSTSRRASSTASSSGHLVSSKKGDSGADSLPLPLLPVKKAKRARATSSSEDESEEERIKRTAQLKNVSGGVKRGTRQPIKRGGKRF